MRRRSVAVSVVMLALLGCGTQDPPLDSVDALATVAGQAITAEDLARYEQALPDHLRSEKEGAHAHRVHLQSLVDTRLILLEAQQRGLDQLPSLQRALSALVNKRIAEELQREVVSAQIIVTEQDLLTAYDEHLLGWEIWPAHILSATEEDAREIIRLVEEGANFAELARERSLADDADQGGDLRSFFGPGDAVTTLREGVFLLEEGQVSEPIPTKDGFEVVMVLEKRRTSFGALRAEISQQVIRRKEVARFHAVIDSLRQARNVLVHGERLRPVLEGLQGRELSHATARGVLVEYEGGVITVGDAVLGLRPLLKGGAMPDSTALRRTIKLRIMPDSLLAVEARDRGIHEREHIVAWTEKERQSLLVSQLYRDELSGKVVVTDDEARAVYDENIEIYTSLPGVIHLTEVLCDTRAEAEQVLAQAQAGERLEVLASRHSVRPGMEPVGGHAFSDSGRVIIESLFKSPYRTALGESNTTDVGVVQGPLDVQDRYGIFRLDQPIELLPVEFRQVRKPIRARIRKNREGVLFDVFLDSLRGAYADRVQIHEEGLSRYATAP